MMFIKLLINQLKTQPAVHVISPLSKLALVSVTLRTVSAKYSSLLALSSGSEYIATPVPFFLLAWNA